MKDNEEIINVSRKILRHLISHQGWYLLVLMIIVLGTPLLSNFFYHKPLLMGGESYHNLYLIRNSFPAIDLVPQWALALISPLLAIISLFLFLKLARKIQLSEQFTFFFLLFFILSPPFIWTYISLSTFPLFILLSISGFLLLTQKNNIRKWFSLIPFVLATFFDLFNSLLLLLMLFFYLIINRKKHDKFSLITMLIIVLSMIINGLILRRPFFQGPFHITQIVPDLISDFGGQSGIGLFLLLLAMIGLMVTWKRKSLYQAYFFLPLVIPAYFFNTRTIFILTLVVSFFAAVGFIKLFELKWSLETLKRFTFLLLLLGLVFSTISYLDRVTLNGPTEMDQKILTKGLGTRIISEPVIFSDPEQGYYIRYFAAKEPFYLPHFQSRYHQNISQSIPDFTYISDLFPLLEEHKINVIYLTPQMKEELPSDIGLLFLLKNERFKLIYASEGYEVWEFQKE